MIIDTDTFPQNLIFDSFLNQIPFHFLENIVFFGKQILFLYSAFHFLMLCCSVRMRPAINTLFIMDSLFTDTEYLNMRMQELGMSLLHHILFHKGKWSQKMVKSKV